MDLENALYFAVAFQKNVVTVKFTVKANSKRPKV